MDEYDLLLNEINREKRIKEEKKFWRGRKWNKKQREEMEKQGKSPLKLNRIKKGEIMNKYDRNSHWPIYGMFPIELIKVVADTVRKAPVETVASKDGMVVHFIGKVEDGQKWQLERGKNE